MLNNMEAEIFNNDIKIISQNIKIIQYFTNLGEELVFDYENLEIDHDYHVLTSKINNRDHVIILEFKFIEKASTNKQINKSNLLNIVVEGKYLVNDDVAEEKISSAKHFGSLNLLLNYLRTVIYNITSMTLNGGHYLPLVNIASLHEKNKMKKKKKKE